MLRDEYVIFPFPASVAELQRELMFFAEQFQGVGLVEVRGSFIDEQQCLSYFVTWQSVAQTDSDLDLVGLGVVGADDESLFWLAPHDDVEVRFSLMEEEN